VSRHCWTIVDSRTTGLWRLGGLLDYVIYFCLRFIAGTGLTLLCCLNPAETIWHSAWLRFLGLAKTTQSTVHSIDRIPINYSSAPRPAPVLNGPFPSIFNVLRCCCIPLPLPSVHPKYYIHLCAGVNSFRSISQLYCCHYHFDSIFVTIEITFILLFDFNILFFLFFFSLYKLF
jgi:hypothetical protein